MRPRRFETGFPACAWARRSAVMLAIACLLSAPMRAGADDPASGPSLLDLRGMVKDNAGQVLSGGVVFLPKLGLETRIASDGSFVFARLPAGRYEVIVDHLGYAPVTRRVLLDASTGTVDVTMQATPFRLPAVTVTATRVGIDPLSSPLPVSELGEERLLREQSVSLAHALSDIAGVRTLGTGQQIGKPVIRGLSGPRVLVLDNGHRLEDYSWSDEDGPSVDARLARRVEVIRGPASVLYGSDALGGVVNVIPAEVPDARSGLPFRRGGMEIYGATNNVELGSALRFEGASGSTGWRLFGIGRHASDFRTPEGKLHNTGFFAVNGEGVVGVHADRGNATLRYARYGGEFKLLEANAPPNEEGGPERRTSDDRVQFDGNYFTHGMRLESKAQWQRHSLSELADAAEGGVAPPPGTKKEIVTFDLLLNTVSLDLLAHHSAGSHVTGTAGVSGHHQTNDTRVELEPLIPHARINSGAVFAFEEARFGRWSFLGGARGDVRRLTADADTALGLQSEKRDYNVFSGDVGAVFRPVEELALAANVGRAWRAPTLFELFANGPHIGEGRWELGDSTLVAEKSLDVDASVRWRHRSFRGEVSGYRNKIDDFLFIAPTGQIRESLPVFRYEQAEALLTGGEVSAEVEPLQQLTVRGRFDVVRGENQEKHEPLPLIPPERGALELELHSTSLGWADRGYVGAETELVAKQTRRTAFDIPTASYALVNLEVGMQRPMFGRAARFDLRLSNVANVKYRDYLSRYKAFALDPGRNLLLRLSVGL